MASLYIQFSDKNVYTCFNTLEEAYFWSRKIFKKPNSYQDVISKLNNHYLATVGFDEHLHVMIYYGKMPPPRITKIVKFVDKKIVQSCI
jgi:hypothetical protein